MKKCKILSAVCLFRAFVCGVLFAGLSANALVADEYQDALMRFLNISQANAALNQMLNDKQALNALYAEYGNKLSKAQKTQIAQAYNEYMSGAYNDMLAVLPNIYKKYLSLSDLEELIKFYQTQLGASSPTCKSHTNPPKAPPNLSAKISSDFATIDFRI